MCTRLECEHVARGGIARRRTSAPRIRADGRRRGCILKGIAVADNLFLVRARLDVRFPRAVCIQLRAECFAVLQCQTACVFDKKRRICRRVKICLDCVKVKIRICRCQRQLRGGVLESYRLEVVNLLDRRRRVYIQRVALLRANRAVAARDFGMREIAAVKVDRVVVRLAV